MQKRTLFFLTLLLVSCSLIQSRSQHYLFDPLWMTGPESAERETINKRLVREQSIGFQLIYAQASPLREKGPPSCFEIKLRVKGQEKQVDLKQWSVTLVHNQKQELPLFWREESLLAPAEFRFYSTYHGKAKEWLRKGIACVKETDLINWHEQLELRLNSPEIPAYLLEKIILVWIPFSGASLDERDPLPDDSVSPAMTHPQFQRYRGY